MFSSVGRAAPLQGVGQEFEPLNTHHNPRKIQSHQKSIIDFLYKNLHSSYIKISHVKKFKKLSKQKKNLSDHPQKNRNAPQHLTGKTQPKSSNTKNSQNPSDALAWLAQQLDGIDQLNIYPHIQVQQKQHICAYIALLLQWNAHYNLTAVTDIHDIYTHHILDCLAALTHWQHDYTTRYPEPLAKVMLLDVGSGAGLPGLLWAMMRSDMQVYSVDAVAKKIAFQQQVKLHLHIANFHPLHTRVEQASLPPMDYITARAYADVPTIIESTQNIAKSPQGAYFLLKGQVQEDMLTAQSNYDGSQIQQIAVPLLEAVRHVMIVPFSLLR